MPDSDRLRQFADVLVNHSARVGAGDNVYLLCKSLDALPLFEAVRNEIIDQGGLPHEHLLYDSQIGMEGLDHAWMTRASDEQLETVSEAKVEEMRAMDAYVRIGGPGNTKELSDVDPARVSKRKEATQDILADRLDTRWVVTRYPTDALAQAADMSTPEFEEFVVDAVTGIDWDDLEAKNERVKERFDGAEEVRIVGQGTDLTLSLAGREGVPDNGLHNVPSGEVFYAPLRESLEGRVQFSYPAVDSGNEVAGIELVFEEGRIVEYSAERNGEYLGEMIETDEGSHYVGELGIGTNRQIDRYIKDTLFDEKIGGTIHLALGRAYEKCVPEGEEPNQSGIHWDLVKDLRPRGGGGRIEVDGEVVQEDGEWTFADLN